MERTTDKDPENPSNTSPTETSYPSSSDNYQILYMKDLVKRNPILRQANEYWDKAPPETHYRTVYETFSEEPVSARFGAISLTKPWMIRMGM